MEHYDALTLVTPEGVYAIGDGTRADVVVTTDLTALQYAARHLTHTQWSQVLRSERAVHGQGTIRLPDDAEVRRR